jgi:hypothetical protein
MAKIIELVTNAGQVDVTKGIVEEAIKAVPEVDFFDAGTIPGTTLATLARTSLPTVAFRQIGDPVSSSRSGFKKRTVELALLSGRIEISEAEALANALMTIEEQETDEAVATLQAAFLALATQIWYGAKSGKGDSKGFDGAVDLVDAALVTKAGNGTDGANTSVWFVKTLFKKDAGLAFSRNSKILSATDMEFRKGDILVKQDSAVVGVEPGYIGDLTSWAGLHLANKNALARLCNVTTTTGLNDDMLTDCIEAFAKANNGARPDGIFMSFNARKMLRKSRTLTFSSKKGVDVSQYAPIPTDVDGIPVFASSAILDTEATVTAGDSSES